MNDKEMSKFDDELMAAASELATEVSPERDLWPGIEDVILSPAAPARRTRLNVFAQAAAVLLLVGGSSGLTYLAMSGGSSTVPQVPVDGPERIFEPVAGSFGSMYNLGPDYQDARRSLTAKVANDLNHLTPEERAAVQQNIEMIRSAIDDINKALADDPDNVLLQKMLLSAYREELELMMKIDNIRNSAMRRGDI